VKKCNKKCLEKSLEIINEENGNSEKKETKKIPFAHILFVYFHKK
jgi:hypothetical protein